MSDANRKRISIVQESSYGVTPTSPTMHVLETTGQSLRDIIGYQQSQTIRNDANVRDAVRLSKSAGGGLPCEFVFPTVNEALWYQIRAAMRTTESAAVVNGNDFTLTSGAVTCVRATGSWITDGFAVGDIVKLFTLVAADNRWAKVTAVVALTLTLQLGDGDTWSTNHAAGTCAIARGARMTNGTTDYSFSIEVASPDITKYQLFTGQVVEGMSLSVADQAITQCGFTYQGSDSTRVGTEISGATYQSPTANAVMDSIGVPHFYLGGASFDCKSFGIDINNNLGPRTKVGTLGATSMRRGQFGATGRVQAYHQTFTEMDAYATNTPSDMWFVLVDSSAQSFAVSMPQMKWTDIAAPTRGINQDDYLEGTFSAYLDPTELCTVKVFRFVI